MAKEISAVQHPSYAKQLANWKKFRLVAESGQAFIDAYLEKYSAFEQPADFEARKKLTYNPGHATAVLRLVKNAIFQRLADVTRVGGPQSYQLAVSGADGGVDRQNRGMNSFLGDCVLPDMLAISKIGIYVDMPPVPVGANLQEAQALAPYLYTFAAEDILSWDFDNSRAPGRFRKLLLREHLTTYDEVTRLPDGTEDAYRLLTRTPEGVFVERFNKDGKPTDQSLLELRQIPFVLADLDFSLLTDIANHQITLLNLASSDVNFLWRGGFPIYTEQFDGKFGSNIRRQFPTSQGTEAESRTAEPTVPAGATAEITQALYGDASGNGTGVGVSRGRQYGKGLERPGFIHPSSEPVDASMRKQAHMADEVRLLADLALSSLASKYASGEAKKVEKEGLEAGLSYIGLVLERVENEIAQVWAEYESTEPAKVSYPSNYSLRTEADRRSEAKEYKELVGAVPSKTFSKEIQRKIVHVLIGNRATAETISEIDRELVAAKGLTADPETIRSDHEAGFVSTATASMLRGYPLGECEQAKKDHAERMARIAAAQSDPGSRGVKDMSGDPDAGKKEKELKDVDT